MEIDPPQADGISQVAALCGSKLPPLLLFYYRHCCFGVTACALKSSRLQRRSRCTGTADVDQTHGKSLQLGRLGAARICRPWSREIGTTLRARLADRPLRWLFRVHVDVLPRLAPTARGRGSHHGPRGAAGELARKR